MKYIAVALLLFLSEPGESQSLIDSIGSPGFTLKDTISDKLAEFAVNNMLVKADDAEIKGMAFEIQKNKAAWLNSFNASFNLNEANLKAQSSDPQNLFFPRYNFSVVVPLGSFFTRAKDVQIARAKHEKSVADRAVDIQNIKTAIKTQYQEYLSNKYFLALHEMVLQDDRVLLSVIEKKFEQNEPGTSLEALTTASKKYNDELVKKISLLKDLNNSKIALESLIGMTLEDALLRIPSNN